MFTNKLLFYSILILWNTNLVFSQPAQYWIKYFTNDRAEYTRDLAKDNNGNYIITGTSMTSLVGSSNYGVVTVKYDSLGHQLWVNTKDDSSYDEDSYQILLDDSNNVHIFGIVETDKFFLIKYDVTGNEKWYREFNSSITNYEVKDRSCIDDEGNVYCVGAYESANGKLSFVRKYSTNGDVIWYKEFESLSTIADEPCTISYDGHKFLYMAGVTTISDTNKNHYLTKFDKQGNVSWSKNYGSYMTSYRKPIKIVLANDSNLYLMGTSLTQAPDYDINIIKVDSSGNKIWENFVTSTAGHLDYPNDIIVDLNLDVYITGFVRQFVPPSSQTELFTIIKFSGNGDLIWSELIGDSLQLRGRGISLQIDESNNLYVAGGLELIPPLGSYDMLIAKYTPDGNSIWSITKDFNYVDDFPVKLLLNSEDDFTTILNGVQSFVTIRYSNNSPVGVDDNFNIDQYVLQQNYPNPFNPITRISYSLPNSTFVNLKVFDILGNEIETLVNKVQSPGKYDIEFDGSDLSSGIYLYRLITNNYLQTRKMILIK